jgi:hypothetical protein
LGPETDGSKEMPIRVPPTDPDVVFGTVSTLTLSDVCDVLPPRSIVDQVLSGYFNGKQTQIREYTLSFTIVFTDRRNSDSAQCEVPERGGFLPFQSLFMY